MKQNIIQSIIRRGLSFVFLSLLMPLGVGAQTNYNLWIGNTQVTSENAGDVLGDGKVAFSVGGDVAVVYTLTLKGAELTAPVKVGLSNLTFDVRGNNTITVADACIQNVAESFVPSLTFKSNADVVGSLTLTDTDENSTNGVISNSFFGKFTINKELALVMLRSGNYTSDPYYFSAGEVHDAQLVPSYGVTVEAMQVYAGNTADVFGDGKVSFDKETATLTLNNVSDISTISTTLSTLNIELVGSNSLYRSSDGSIFESLSGEAVTFNFQSTGSIKGGLTIETPENYGATIKGDNVTLTPVDPIALLSSNVENNKGTLVYGVSYNLWVAGTQVTTANANDIKGDGIGDGEVAFDGVNTLKLSGANLAGPIQSSLANLIVEIDGTCTFDLGQAAAPYAFITEEAGSILTFTTKEPSSSISVSEVQSAPFSGYADGNIKFLNELVGSLSESGAGYQIAVPNVSYGFSVDDVEVTKQNRLSIGDGVKFDGKNTLILNSAEINRISISASANQTLTNGLLKIYLIGDNTIGSQASDGLVNKGANMPLTFATSDVEPGTLQLSYSDQPLAGFTPTYLNNLTDMMNPDQHQITIAVSMEPFVTKEYYEAENKGANGQGIGQDIESRNTAELKDGVIVNKILYTLPSDDDGYIDDYDYVTANGKVVALNTPMDDGEVNDILEFIKNGLIQPGTKLGDPHTFAYYFHGMSFLLPAGCGDIVLDVNTNQSGELHVKVGNNDPVVISGTTGFEERRVPYALTEESYVFLYSVAPVVSSSRHRAPGRKMANTTTLKSVKVSARSVAATPPPVLMSKVLTKDDVAAAKSGNHITIIDTDVTDYTDDAFKGLTGITYVDLSATSITGKKFDRTKLELPAYTTVFLPVSNDDNSEKNIVIAGVCNDLQLNEGADFEIPSDFTAVKASLSRDFTSDLGKNCTVCVPFALDDTQAAKLGTFYTLSAHSGNTITMESVDATEANKAYMFKPSKETFSAEMVDVKKADPVRTTVNSLSFLGTYQQITGLNSTADCVYYCFMQTGPQAGKFVKITSAVDVNPFRAYMELPASESLARVLDLNFGEGGATGIGSLTPNPSSIGEGNVGFYDLQGRRVLYPKKGLYILNGKKVIIK